MPGGPPRPQGDAQPDISASCSHIRPPAIHGRLWTSPCVRGGPQPAAASERRSATKAVRASWLPPQPLWISVPKPTICLSPSRAPGGVLPAGHGWPAAGRGSRTRTPAGGAHPPVRATGSAGLKRSNHAHDTPAVRHRAGTCRRSSRSAATVSRKPPAVPARSGAPRRATAPRPTRAPRRGTCPRSRGRWARRGSPSGSSGSAPGTAPRTASPRS